MVVNNKIQTEKTRNRNRNVPLLVVQTAVADPARWQLFSITDASRDESQDSSLESSPCLSTILAEVRREFEERNDKIGSNLPVGFTTVPFRWLEYMSDNVKVLNRLDEYDIAACLVDEDIVCSESQSVHYRLLAAKLENAQPTHIVVYLGRFADSQPCHEVGQESCHVVRDAGELKLALGAALERRHLRDSPIERLALITAILIESQYGKLPSLYGGGNDK